MHLFTIPLWAWASYNLPCAALGIWKGGWRGRIIAIALLTEFLTETSIFVPLPPYWFRLSLDFAILAACLAGALSGGRYWTIFAASFALLEVLTHGLQFAPGVGLWAYLSAQYTWSAMIYASLAVGALTDRHASRRAIPFGG